MPLGDRRCQWPRGGRSSPSPAPSLPEPPCQLSRRWPSELNLRTPEFVIDDTECTSGDTMVPLIPRKTWPVFCGARSWSGAVAMIRTSDACCTLIMFQVSEHMLLAGHSRSSPRALRQTAHDDTWQRTRLKITQHSSFELEPKWQWMMHTCAL